MRPESTTAAAPPAAAGENRPWPRRLRQSTFATAAVGSLLLWLAQPPLAWGWLAWVAPASWLVLAARREPIRRGGYAQLWLAGVVYWLFAVHWVRLPHPATPIGWGFLAAYLGCYLPVFVWLVRSANRRLRAPLWLAASIAWTGLEWLQAHLFSGFLMGALSHTQAGWVELIQIADTLGAYGVSFVMMFVTACLCRVFSPTPAESITRRCGAIVAAGAVVGFVLWYGNGLRPRIAGSSTWLKVALIQGNTLAVWDYDLATRNREIMDRQVALSQQAVEEAATGGKRIDLIVWPESMFRPPLVTFDGSHTPPPDAAAELVETQEVTGDWFRQLVTGLGAPLLMGCDRFDIQSSDGSQQVYNSSVLVGADGEIVATYDKTHRVPFGEYIPLAKNLPALYFMTPMEGGLRPGAGPVAMPIETAAGETVTLSPNICYETVIPHVIHGQVRELTDAGTPPDLLVNLTNDAWFWGSSELDMHLACDIFRAVETRRPMVVCANGGLSAVIDASGRVLAKSERMQEQAIVVDVRIGPRQPGAYVRYGDWFAAGCLIACGLVVIISLAKKEPPMNADERG